MAKRRRKWVAPATTKASKVTVRSMATGEVLRTERAMSVGTSTRLVVAADRRAARKRRQGTPLADTKTEVVP